MNPSNRPSPGTRSPFPTSHSRSHSQPFRRNSSSSDSSSSSQVTAFSAAKRSPYIQPQGAQGSRSNISSATQQWGPQTLQNFSRPSISHAHNDQNSRGPSPLTISAHPPPHQPPQHSQGFFEPSLPTASSSNQPNMPNMNASQIAAQAAMQHQSSQQHARKRSQTTPSPQSPPDRPMGRRKPTIPTPIQTGLAASATPQPGSLAGSQQHTGSLAGTNAATAATTAANAAYPRSAHSSPGFPPPEPAPPLPEVKPKAEKSKMKLFSKPKNIGITKDKDVDKKDRLPSPNKIGGHVTTPLTRLTNASTTSLAETSSAGSSIYGTTNNSTATLVPSADKTASEKHKHHFLSRQKHKHKDKDDHHHLPLSSASSNSKPLDPSAPQSFYSFAPSSPSPAATTFAKSMSGLDLRHGGRALREKKKEEKASAMDPTSRDTDSPFPGAAEWPGPPNIAAVTAPAFLSPPTGSSLTQVGDSLGVAGLQGIGLPGMTPDDAWPFLRAKLLVIFEGEDLRLPIEDFNKLVSAHLQRCIQKRTPNIITEDLRDLLRTGFSFLDQTLRAVPDERLVRSLVDMWLVVFGTILPYVQAVFLPLDLEFKGSGSLMNAREAQDFWGALPGDEADSPLGDALDVRRIVLLSYRDTVILPRHDTLKAIFSRLSLESINGGPTSFVSNVPRGPSPDGRPGTAMSLDPGLASFNSQGSTLLGDTATTFGARSRATSNTSSAFGAASSGGDGGLLSSSPRLRQPVGTSAQTTTQPQDSARVTETVGRMLQCVAVLGSVQSADEAQVKMEGLAKTLKLNWLGRGRTGRNRRGFVGTRVVGPTRTGIKA